MYRIDAVRPVETTVETGRTCGGAVLGTGFNSAAG